MAIRKRLLLFFTLIVSPAFCQNWCPPGAVWTYSLYGNIAGISGSCEFNYEGDTTINGHLLKRITGLFKGYDIYRFSYLPYFTYTVAPNYSQYFMKEADDVVYVMNSQKELDTVVDYAAKVGDKWRAPLGCNMFTVSDTSSTVINGTRLRVIKAQFSDPTWGSDSMLITNTFIERVAFFMGAGDGFDFVPSYCIDTTRIAEFPAVWFLCYRDSQLGEYSPGKYICRSTLSVTEEIKPKATLFFIPGTKELCVEYNGTQTASMFISDMLGCLVKEIQIKPGKNLIGFNRAGIYLFQVKENSNVLLSRKMVLEN